MNWSIVFCTCGVYGVAVCYLAGVFRWLDRKLNDHEKPAADITPGDIAVIRADIEKLKLALNLKEFKR